MTRLLLLIGFAVSAAAQGEVQGWHRVVGTRCGLAIHVPERWVIQPVTWDFGSKADCAIGLRPPGWLTARKQSDLEISPFAIYIGATAGTLETACAKDIVCRDSRGWYFEGRAGARSEGHEVRTRIGRGIRGEIETGAYRKEGGYAGASDAMIAVVNRDNRLAEFIADTQFRDESIFTRIFETFEFR